MGHAIDYYVTDKRSNIMSVAEKHAFYNTDRGENPSGSYHGNMHIHDKPICESYEDAVEHIASWDTGWYSDHAVQFKDRDALKPTKQMESLRMKADKIRADKAEYIKKHSIKERKSEYSGCKKCGSRLSNKHLRSNRCPLCGADLRADYIVERIDKYDKDCEETLKKLEELKRKQSGKCLIRWLVKVEVHC